jgi:hypothetical protein
LKSDPQIPTGATGQQSGIRFLPAKHSVTKGESQ